MSSRLGLVVACGQTVQPQPALASDGDSPIVAMSKRYRARPQQLPALSHLTVEVTRAQA